MRLPTLAAIALAALCLTSASATTTSKHKPTTSSKHKATTTSKSSKTSAHHGKTSTKASKQAATHTATPGMDPERATQIQSALIHSGYLTGEPSGKWDADSIAAVKKLQSDHGWQTKVVPDARALIALGLGPQNPTN